MTLHRDPNIGPAAPLVTDLCLRLVRQQVDFIVLFGAAWRAAAKMYSVLPTSPPRTNSQKTPPNGRNKVTLLDATVLLSLSPSPRTGSSLVEPQGQANGHSGDKHFVDNLFPRVVEMLLTEDVFAATR
jgi:hypothetical protein